MQKLEEIRSLLLRLGNVKLNRILNLTAFSSALIAHFNRDNDFDIDTLLKDKELKFSKRDDILKLCKLIDGFYREVKTYKPLLKEDVFEVRYEVNSLYEREGLKTNFVLYTNFIDVLGLIEKKLKPFISIENIQTHKVIVRNCISSDNYYISENEVYDFVRFEDSKYNFCVDEENLDDLINILYKLPKEFDKALDTIYLCNDINLIIDLIPRDFKNVKIHNFISDRKVEEFLLNNGITKLSQLNNIEYKNANNEYLRCIFDVLLSKSFEKPQDLQLELISGLKDKYQLYATMRYQEGLKYTEMAERLGVTRAGAQALSAKVERIIRHRHYLTRKLISQILLFRDNDYFMFEDTLTKLGVWLPLLTNICEFERYKSSNIFTFDDYYLYSDKEDNEGTERDEEEEETLSEETTSGERFGFIETLPNIIKKKDINKYVEFIIENSKKAIGKQDIKNVINLNYIDYGMLISKTKLNTNYFFKYILENYYPDGLNVYDKTNIENVKLLLNNLFNYEIDCLSDRYISSRIPKLCTLVGRGVWKYNVNVELPEEVIDKINVYIASYPIAAVPISSIYENFADELLEYGIENKYSLQGILRNIINPNYKATKDYVYTDDSQTFVERIAEFIKNSKILVTREVLEQNFPGFQMTSMQRISSTTPVVNMNGYFASMDNMAISEEEKVLLKEELNTIVEDEKTHNSKNIFYRFKSKFNGLFNRIGINHYLQLYYILNKLFEDDFEFLRPFIAKKGFEIQDKEHQLIEKIVEEWEITKDRLRDLCYEVGYFMESIMDLVIRNNDEILFKNEHVIVSTEKIDINEEKLQNIDTILDKYMLYSDYMFLKEVAIYSEIKELCENMNEWLLYSLISAYSTKYKVYRTDNVMSRTQLILAKEDFDKSKIENLSTSNPVIFDMEDLLDIEDLED